MYQKLLLLVMLSIYVHADKTEPQFRFDYKYSTEANGWLKLHYGPMSWYMARLQCYYEGAVLASPLNQNFRDGLARFLQNKISRPEVMYSGVSASFSPGIYTTVEGIPLERLFVHWSANEPALSEGCLVFYSNGTMASKHCGNNYPFICYKKYEKLFINECGTVDNGYRYDNGSKKCYKHHKIRHNWSMAYKTCRAEGAFLTDDTRRSFDEYMLISDIFLGVRYYMDGYWWQNDGTISQYFVEESNNEPPYLCGVRQSNGIFTSYDCKGKRQFICEKAIDSLLLNENEEN